MAFQSILPAALSPQALRTPQNRGNSNPFAADVWLIEQLGFAEFAYQPSKTISFTGIEPVWLRELIKRWARWRLRAGTYTPGTVSSLASAFKQFSDFVAASGHRLDGPACLTRQVLEDYREHVATLGHSRKHQHGLISAMKVLLDEVRANGWEPGLPATAAYYKGGSRSPARACHARSTSTSCARSRHPRTSRVCPMRPREPR